jgi:signal transduction histidine kinase
VLALMIVVWVLVGRTLRPVERIRARVAEIGMGELDQRVPVPAGGDEVARLAVTMNEMLARLESAARRQQQFVADASHELRTPLTRMRVELEVDERDPEHADPAATRHSQLEEITGMQRMIEDLLLLARGDAGQLGEQDWQTVDLDDVVLDEIAATAASQGVHFDASAVSAAQVSGSRDELRRVVRNLVENAARHARATVAVELGEHGESAVLTVGDDGPGIPPGQRALVFERFGRLDEARSGDRTGLGLAIVHDIVLRHGGSVVIGDHALGGAAVTITLPKVSGQPKNERVSRAAGSPADG